MLVFHFDQIDVLEAHQLKIFEERTVAHCQNVSEALCKAAGQQAVAAFVQDAIGRGRAFGLNGEHALTCFVEGELVLGARMAEDPAHPWIERALGGEEPGHACFPRFRDDLYEWLIATGALDADQHQAHLERLRGLIGEIQPDADLTAETEDCVRFAKRMSPARAELVGNEPLRALGDQALAEADRLGVRNPPDRLFLFAVLHEFGSYCLDNPLYPWIARALSFSPDRREPSLDNLRRKIDIWLDAAEVNAAKTESQDALS